MGTDRDSLKPMPPATVRFSQAKRNFRKVAARVKRGDTILLQHGPDVFQLVYQAPAATVPLRPPGFFKLDAQDLAGINGARSDETA